MMQHQYKSVRFYLACVIFHLYTGILNWPEADARAQVPRMSYARMFALAFEHGV